MMVSLLAFIFIKMEKEGSKEFEAYKADRLKRRMDLG